jgi:hypothetical protein
MSSHSPYLRSRVILLAGFAVGLLLRVLMLPYKGTFDMDANAAWGRAVVHDGLAHAYAGGYFPLAYQVFGAVEWLASRLGVDAIPVYKAANLAFDVGTFWVLVALLRQSRGGPLFALLYWLHPWFLSVFSLGYVDSHFTFFVLLWLWLVRDATTAGQYFVAGIPLALAVMLKPQAVLPAASVLAYLWFKRRDQTIGQTAYVLAPAVLVFAAYELYFAAALFPERGIDALRLLPASYVRIGSIQPVLTAHMPNIWYVVAYVLPGGQDLWNVSSKMHLLPFVQARFFALVVTLAAITWYAHLLAGTRSSRPNGSPFFYLTAFTSLAVPMLMTSAHENHLFLATVLMIALLASGPGRMAAAAIHGTLILQCLNLELIYGLNSVAMNLRDAYTADVRLAVAMISVVLSGVIAWRLYAAVAARPAQMVVTDRDTRNVSSLRSRV